MQTTIKLNAHLHPGQLAVHENAARFKVLAAGRRWGKTRLGVNECLSFAMRGMRSWWVAPNYKTGEVGWRPLRRMGSRIGAEVRKVDRQVILPNGGDVTVRSADDPNSLRGEGLDFVVMDECAYMNEEAWTEALRPALSDRMGKAMFISTPAGRNWFWRLWMRGQGDDHNWKAWRLPTSDNPYIDPAEIEAARESLPELIFRQEYLAEFLEGEGAVFRNITACMGAQASEILKHNRHRIVAGVDWGKQADYTAVSVGCADCRVEVARDRFNKIDYVFQRKRLMALLDRWNNPIVNPERNSMGEPVVEQLSRDGVRVIAGTDGKLGFFTNSTNKPQLIENLALVFEREEWQFIADPIWTGELEAYERKVSPTTGRSQYSAPEGLHDDTVIARALMVWAAGRAHSLPDEQPVKRSLWLGEDDDNGGGSRWKRY